MPTARPETTAAPAFAIAAPVAVPKSMPPAFISRTWSQLSMRSGFAAWSLRTRLALRSGLAAAGLSLEDAVYRHRHEDEVLPWDHRVARVWCTCFRNREERESPGAFLTSDCRGNLKRIFAVIREYVDTQKAKDILFG